MRNIDYFFLVLFCVSAFSIFWPMVGYPIFLKFLGRVYRNRTNVKNYDNTPTVTVMVVAHNEEKVIHEKLENLKKLSYPQKKINFIVASDNSTDQTNAIVKRFIKANPHMDVKLYETKNRMGKTNAQNEAFSLVSGEILVMTDANSMLEKDAVMELAASFSSPDIAYVTGRLSYADNNASLTAKSEKSYWDLDLSMRAVESRVQTITAGNGALYACRTSEYVCIDPIESHDSSFPIMYALQSKRCVFNPNAVAYEKASQTTTDEFKRKVRMNRLILNHILPDIRILNVIKYRWFTMFYLSHRSLRYSLWLSHLVLLIASVFLALHYKLFAIVLFLQVLFYLAPTLLNILGSKRLHFVKHYVMTLFAQYIGVFNILNGRAKPFWEKAESSR